MYRVTNKLISWNGDAFVGRNGDKVSTEKFEALPPSIQAHWLSIGAVVHEGDDPPPLPKPGSDE